MMDEVQGRNKHAGRRRLRITLAVVLLLLLILVVPPWVSIGRYRGRVAQILSASVGRPVQISSVEMRLLPWPGFLISNLSIAEDPAYGAEPVLHANTVRANIRLLPLWRGRLEIGSIHVDEASLNIERAGQGSWNLDPLFRTAAARAGNTAGSEASAAFRWPSLEATNSRINIKNGAEKLPFSLVNTDLSFWQESSGEWRIRLRGQPARTDVVLELGDTGTVRIEASLKRAPVLSQMPVRLDLDWRQAQLGALAKLLIGSDPGWRGDLAGNLHLEGTPAAAQITTRLRATGVHRAEFAPRTPLDFDANCTFLYHYGRRAVEKLSCDSPLGNGRMRVTGGMPGGNDPAHFTVEVDRIPVGAGLDLLRTLRSGLAPDLEAAGTVSGRIDYAGEEAEQTVPAKPGKTEAAQRHAANRGPLSGSLTVDGFELSGGALGEPLRVPKMTLQAVEAAGDAAAQVGALEGTAVLNAGGSVPLNVSARLTVSGYETTFRGQAAIARAREMAQTAGWEQADAISNLAGEPLAVNLTAAGSWLAEQQAEAAGSAAKTPGNAQEQKANDSVTGTIMLHNANWKADYLVNHVQIAQATLHLDANVMRWDPVTFSYGPVNGTATITLPVHCVEQAARQPEANCAPQFQVQFGELNASVLEAALLGAREKGTLLSSLIDRLHPAVTREWPILNGTLSASALVLGPVKIEKAAATVTFAADHANISDLNGSLLGGQVQGSGTVSWAGNGQQQPTYSITAHCEKLKAAAVGQLLGQRWTGGPMTVGGKVDFAGYTDSDLAASAKGTLHFDWRRGAMTVGAAMRFDEWSGDAQIANGAVMLKQNELAAGVRRQTLDGAVTFATPPKVRFGTTSNVVRTALSQKK